MFKKLLFCIFAIVSSNSVFGVEFYNKADYYRYYNYDNVTYYNSLSLASTAIGKSGSNIKMYAPFDYQSFKKIMSNIDKIDSIGLIITYDNNTANNAIGVSFVKDSYNDKDWILFIKDMHKHNGKVSNLSILPNAIKYIIDEKWLSKELSDCSIVHVNAYNDMSICQMDNGKIKTFDFNQTYHIKGEKVDRNAFIEKLDSYKNMQDSIKKIDNNQHFLFVDITDEVKDGLVPVPVYLVFSKKLNKVKIAYNIVVDYKDIDDEMRHKMRDNVRIFSYDTLP